MFQYENVVKGKIGIKKVWDLYANVNRWSEWDSDMEKVVLDGEFLSGTNGTMFMKGMPPLPFVLDDVRKDKAFVTISALGEISVTFGHFISVENNGECILKHTVTITGANEAQLQEMGEGIVANIPENMKRLYQLTRID